MKKSLVKFLDNAFEKYLYWILGVAFILTNILLIFISNILGWKLILGEVLFVFSFLCLIVGLNRPIWFNKLFKGKADKKKIGKVFGTIFLVLLACVWSISLDTATYDRQSVLQEIVILIIILGICFYFLPSFIAYKKKKRNSVAIFALNLCLGWTLIGWVISLVWALAYEVKN